MQLDKALRMGIVKGINLVVCSKHYKFKAREFLHGNDGVTLITLPEHVWPRHRVYMETGIMFQLVVDLDSSQDQL